MSRENWTYHETQPHQSHVWSDLKAVWMVRTFISFAVTITAAPALSFSVCAAWTGCCGGEELWPVSCCGGAVVVATVRTLSTWPSQPLWLSVHGGWCCPMKPSAHWPGAVRDPGPSSRPHGFRRPLTILIDPTQRASGVACNRWRRQSTDRGDRDSRLFSGCCNVAGALLAIVFGPSEISLRPKSRAIDTSFLLLPKIVKFYIWQCNNRL